MVMVATVRYPKPGGLSQLAPLNLIMITYSTITWTARNAVVPIQHNHQAQGAATAKALCRDARERAVGLLSLRDAHVRAEAGRLQRQAQACGVPKRPQPNGQLRCARQLHCRRRLNEQVQPLSS